MVNFESVIVGGERCTAVPRIVRGYHGGLRLCGLGEYSAAGDRGGIGVDVSMGNKLSSNTSWPPRCWGVTKPDPVRHVGLARR
jgi:hypothetical protein